MHDIRPIDIWNLTENDAYALFVDFRWADTGGDPVCPRCGALDPYAIRRRKFRCRAVKCRLEFSVTSGTVFHARKLPFKSILMALWEEITAVKGMAALHLGRKIGVQYKTAYVLLQKLREAVGRRRDIMFLQGTVQIDGKYVGGILRKANKKEDREDGRLKENQNGKRMCVLALREANPRAPNRTASHVIADENGKETWAITLRHTRRADLEIVADEASAYDDLIGLASMRRVNHSLRYQEKDRTNTNRIENFFSRVERSYVGIHHRFSVKYLDWYMAMLAWKEDTRYMGLRWQLADVLKVVLINKTSRNLCGYWQGSARRIRDQVWENLIPPS